MAEFAAELRKLREEAGRPNYRELARRASFSVTVLSEAAGGRCLPTLPVVRGYVRACGGDVAEWEERWRLAAERQSQAPAQQAPPAERVPAERVAPRQTEHMAAQPLSPAGRRSGRRTRRLAVSLVVLLAATGVSGGLVVWQRQATIGSTIAAENTAMSGQLAAQSGRFATVNPDAAALAAVAAWQAAPTVTARSALLSLAACCTSTQASLSGESAMVNAVALSPGGKLLAAGGEDRTVHLWDTATGRQLAVFGGFAGPVRAIAFSPVGEGGLLAGSDGHTIRLWDPSRHTTLSVLPGNTGSIEDLAFSPNGTLLASVSADGRICLWNPATHRLVQVLTQHQPGRTLARLLSVAFSPDGHTLAAAGDGPAVALWNITDPAHATITQWLAGMTGGINDLAYSPGGGMIAAEQTNGDVLLLSPQHDPTLLKHAVRNSRGLAFSRDGTLLITAGTYQDLMLWNTSTGRQAGLEPHRVPANVNALAYDPASGSLALGSPTGSVQLWRAPIRPFTGSTGPVTGLALIPGTTMLASVSGDDMLDLWNPDGSPAATTRLTAKPAAVAVSPGGKLLATIDDDGALTLRDIPGLVPTMSVRTVAPAVDAVFSPDGEMVATAARSTIAVRDTGEKSPRHRFYSDGHGSFEAVTFSPDGYTLAAATVQGSVMIWDLLTDRRIAVVAPATGPVKAIAFSPDGQTLAAAGNDGRVTLLTAANLDLRMARAGPVGAIQALAFSPDGKIIASAEHNGTIMLWDTANLSPIATLTGDDGAVNTLAFGPDGNTLISGDQSKRIVVWDLNPADMARQACRTLAGDPDLGQAETLVPNASYPHLCPSR
ncbi:MAG: helix-turn-helix domain-containing protein [Streptosporangiaceae bacterium]|nr:helix-turn-helix domain-containing protein [Streptosporangiaceae bacterium]